MMRFLCRGVFVLAAVLVLAASSGAQCTIDKIREANGSPFHLFGDSIALGGTELEPILAATKRGPILDELWAPVGSGSVVLLAQQTVSPFGWTSITELLPVGGQQGDGFGTGAGFSGDTLIVGAPFHDGFGADSGALYIYERDDAGSATPFDDDWTLLHKLSPNAGVTNLGLEVRVVGDVLFTIGRQAGTYRLIVYHRDSQGTPDPLDDTWVRLDNVAISSAGLQGSSQPDAHIATIDGSFVLTNQGRTHYRNNQGTPADPLDDTWDAGNSALPVGVQALLGSGAGMHDADEILCAGMAHFNDLAGTVFVFRRDDAGTPSQPLDDTWTEVQQLAAPGSYESLGYRMSVSGAHAFFQQYGTFFGHLARTPWFQRDGLGNWQLTDNLIAPDRNWADGFGRDVLVTGDIAWFSASGFPYVDDFAPEEGAVYRMDLSRPATWEVLDPWFGASGIPVVGAWGCLDPGTELCVRNYNYSTATVPWFLVLGGSTLQAPFQGQTLWPSPDLLIVGPPSAPFFLDVTLCGVWPAGVPAGLQLVMQVFVQEPTGDWIGSNALRTFTP